jgi:hypothetical protein
MILTSFKNQKFCIRKYYKHDNYNGQYSLLAPGMILLMTDLYLRRVKWKIYISDNDRYLDFEKIFISDSDVMIEINI